MTDEKSQILLTIVYYLMCQNFTFGNIQALDRARLKTKTPINSFFFNLQIMGIFESFG